MKVKIHFRLNGTWEEIEVEPNRTLLEVLRDEYDLTGAKEGCGEGECGACTVLMDGKAVNSCLVLAAEADGSQITTIEGLSAGGGLDALQEAFIEEAALQCGYCTPGFILAAKALLASTPNPTEQEVREAISGNLCRCTGYESIVKAIMKASRKGDAVSRAQGVL